MRAEKLQNCTEVPGAICRRFRCPCEGGARPSARCARMKTQPLVISGRMNSRSVLPVSPPLLRLQSVCGISGGVFNRAPWLLPLNNGSLGAAKRDPGTNVAIMLMVRITADGHY